LHKVEKVKANQDILVIDASRAIGTAAVQLAKLKGTIITTVCRGKNSPLVKPLGADNCVDYPPNNLSKYQ
jgi:NADPH:quinone reductase-like Zn-dependent oxidoreductase